MKYHYSILIVCCIIINTTLFGQSPATFNYQAVLRDNTGEIMAQENISLNVEILRDSPEGEVVFSETHETETNEFGLVNLKIGSLNALEDVSWGEHHFFLRVFVNDVLMGVQQLVSVPFALHATSSSDSFSGDYEDLINTPDFQNFIALTDPQQGDMIFYHNDTWVSLPPGAEGQVLTVSDGIPQWKNIPEDDTDDGTVSDIDGNIYPVIVIGTQEWLGSNLRTTSFADGTPIAGNLSNSEWQANTTGAWAVYPHDNIQGIDSAEEMLEAYGALYNWFAVDNPAGLCPAGWHVATDDDWTALTDYLIDNYDWIANGNAANVLKSCRQQNSPLGGDCDTDMHPRWNAHGVQHGTDDFDFAGLPGGDRQTGGSYSLMGGTGFWWTSTEFSTLTVFYRDLDAAYGSVLRASTNRERGFAVRCVKSE